LIEGLRRLDEANAGILPEEEPNQSVRFAPVNHSTNQNTESFPPQRSPSGQPPAPPPPPPPSTNTAGPPSVPMRNNEVSRLIDQGFAALRSGQRDDARKFWEEALKLEPTNRMIELNLRKLEAKNLREQR
jgi:hypothetical protein